MKWFQDEKGDASSMRIIAMICAVTGCVAVMIGAVAVVMRIPEGASVAVAGAGMAGLGEVAKAWQAQKGA